MEKISTALDSFQKNIRRSDSLELSWAVYFIIIFRWWTFSIRNIVLAQNYWNL